MIPHVTMASESLEAASKRIRQQTKARPPLRSIKELAEELNVAHMALSRQMHADPEGPRPMYRTGASGENRNTWYNPKEVRAWWAKKNFQKS